MSNHAKCIRVHPYGVGDEIPICETPGCLCILLEGETHCPGCTLTPQGTTEHEITKLVGLATMCWNPIPTGAFDSDLALRVVKDILAKLQSETSLSYQRGQDEMGERMREEIEELTLNEDDYDGSEEIVTKRAVLSLLKAKESTPERCTKCGAPFESHHHIHITREGKYHTSCYKSEAKESNQK